MFCAQCGQWAADSERACGRCGSALGLAAVGTARPAAGAADAPEVRYAGFWRRFGVMLVDALVMFFPTALLRVAMGLDAFGQDNDFEDPRYWSATAASVLMWLLYCALLESSAAQGTLGQQVFGIRVCDLRLRRISFLRAAGRHFAQWVSALMCGFGYLVNLWTRRRQALHDLMAGTVHVRAESLATAQRAEAA